MKGLPMIACSESNAIVCFDPHPAIHHGKQAMAVLTIRNLPDEVRDRLRLRAARAGHSMEAEVRDILTRASLEPDGTVNKDELQDWVDQLYGEAKPDDVVEQLIQDRRREADAERRTPNRRTSTYRRLYASRCLSALNRDPTLLASVFAVPRRILRARRKA
jgi:plasmid stability protein